MLDLFVDADACPVKEKVCRVAARYKLKVTFVANAWMRVPDDDLVELIRVEEGADAADDWIAEAVGGNEKVVTGDLPLAARCLKKGARGVSPKGRIFTEDSISDALASRDLLSYLHTKGTMTGGQAPFGKRDRSQFLQRPDEIVQAVRGKRLGPFPSSLRGHTFPAGPRSRGLSPLARTLPGGRLVFLQGPG